MEDMLRNKVRDLCRDLAGRGLKDVLGLELGAECSWASYLVIGTVTSRVHMRGAASAAADVLRKMGMDCGLGKKYGDNPWHIIDGGAVVVSLMDAESRSFYALEERWYGSQIIFDGTDSGNGIQSSISS